LFGYSLVGRSLVVVVVVDDDGALVHSLPLIKSLD
jgi:hypothetical protein